LEIFVANSDGSSLKQLTHNSAYDWEPHISADGSKIAFHSLATGNLNIFVINSDGTKLTQLTHNTASNSHPSISADGSKIAFESDVTGTLELFVVNTTSQPDNPLIPWLILIGGVVLIVSALTAAIYIQIIRQKRKLE